MTGSGTLLHLEWLVGRRETENCVSGKQALGHKQCTAKHERGSVTIQNPKKSRAQRVCTHSWTQLHRVPVSTHQKAWEHCRDWKGSFPKQYRLGRGRYYHCRKYIMPEEDLAPQNKSFNYGQNCSQSYCSKVKTYCRQEKRTQPRLYSKQTETEQCWAHC